MQRVREGVRERPYNSLVMRVRLSKTFTFEAAHFLPSFPDGHKCRRMHGHSFRVDVIVEGELPAGQHHLVDYGDIAAAIEPVRIKLDHYCLNEVKGLENPTSEMLAKWIWERLRPVLPMLAQIDIWETCTSRCEYRGS
jgi:6-pyruvoyltetrahydropterin/6-carboxytetrahydropterin synthase